MTKRALIVLHRHHSVSGRVGTMLKQRGYELDYACMAADGRLPRDMSGHDCAVIYGGPMSVNEADDYPFLHEELDWLPEAVNSGKPVLGLCLGAQLMAKAHGANVAPRPDRRVEVGYYSVTPTSTKAGASWFPEPMHVYQFHGDGMEVPPGAVKLAESAGFPVQAFGFRGRPAFGLQFHPEVTRHMLERWVVRASFKLEEPGAQEARLHLAGHALYDEALERWLNTFMDRWLAGETV